MVPGVWYGTVDGFERYLVYGMGLCMVWKGARCMLWFVDSSWLNQLRTNSWE
jgi:hypothetical protein